MVALAAVIGLAPTRVALPSDSSFGDAFPFVEDVAPANAAVEAAEIDPAGPLYAALSTCGSSLPEEERWVIADTIVNESWRHGYDPLFVQAIVEVESTCSPNARSNAGALGLIQVKPSTARGVAERSGILWEGSEGLLRPEVNVEIGLRYLAELEERFSDPYLAVAAYNLGPSRVAQMEPHHARRSRYVRKVMNRYEGLLRAHPTSSPS